MSRLSNALPAWLLLTAVRALADDDVQSQQRLQMMEQEIAQYAIDAPPPAPPPAFQFVTKPLLRYSDPTRGSTASNVLIDATVWRLGAEGRPLALVTLEIYRSSATQGILSLECLSLSRDRFVMQHKEMPRITWDANQSALSLTSLPEAPEPAPTAPARLLQLRQFAKRFAVHEKLGDGQNLACRLLPQPIDRYQAPDEQIVDGAIFAFANGTNPEVGLVLECDASQWSYGAVRLSSAEMTVFLDEREIATFPHVNSLNSTRGSYVAHTRAVELPE